MTDIDEFLVGKRGEFRLTESPDGYALHWDFADTGKQGGFFLEDNQGEALKAAMGNLSKGEIS